MMVPSWAQEVPWSDGGSKTSSVEEQFEAIKKDALMEQSERDLGSGGVDVLAKMDAKQAEELLENMTGISKEKKKMTVWRKCGRRRRERKDNGKMRRERRRKDG